MVRCRTADDTVATLPPPSFETRDSRTLHTPFHHDAPAPPFVRRSSALAVAAGARHDVGHPEQRTIPIMSTSLLSRVTLVTLALPSIAFAPVPTGDRVAEPIKYARYPHISSTGLITFSYQADIWIANEDGSSPRRLTNNVAR